MQLMKRYLCITLPILVAALTVCIDSTFADVVSLSPVKDNTLYEFDPSDPFSPCNSNGAGDFFSAGRNRSQSLLRRGLIQFDFSGIPAGAVVTPGSLNLSLEVVDMPKKDTSGEDRDFWLVPLTQAWGEGTSQADVGISGAGSGAAATDGDATWIHTSFDSAIHDPYNPDPSDPGYWTTYGAISAAPVDPTMFGAPSGTVPAAPYLGPVLFGSSSMEADINAWLADPSSNFGWLIIGDERIDGSDVSSNRGFASRENSAGSPVLSFEYTLAVPEPSSAMLLVLGLGMLWWRGRKRP